MERDAIKELLEEKAGALFAYFENQEEEKWTEGPKNKWTSGQQVLHLLQSIKPLNTELSLPKFLLRTRYGTSNREARDYDTIVNRYHERLEMSKGITYGPSQNMKVPQLKEKEYLLNRLQTEYRKLEYKTVNKWSDKDLDDHILPHPLMGKMPVRELIMWTAYHTEHHLKTLQNNY